LNAEDTTGKYNNQEVAILFAMLFILLSTIIMVFTVPFSQETRLKLTLLILEE